tara:strand:- start:4918 stop:5490 length:573 start_codon:yes stop_codon:yes gene_type:complete
MTDIYIEISQLTDAFKRVAYRNTKDKDKVNEAVQELMLYFLSMNPNTLRAIWEKDGRTGIIKYGTVALNRALTSKRSNFYYKYEKYYTHIVNINYTNNSSVIQLDYDCDSKYYKTLSNIPEQKEEYQWEKLEQIDKELDKLYWYDKKLFELYYYESNTLDSLATKTKISRNSLFTTIDKVREILKKELNE